MDVLYSRNDWNSTKTYSDPLFVFIQERTKALGYITSNDLHMLEHPNSKSLKDSGINELKVILIQCLKLVPSQKGNC